MGDLSREEQITKEMNGVLTGLLLEVYAGVVKKDEALGVLAEMKAKIMPAIRAIDKAAEDIRKS